MKTLGIVGFALTSSGLLLAQGGGFGPQQVITTAALGVESVYAVDLDGDGDADVLSASRNPFSSLSRIAWYENLGGSFGPQQVLTTVAAGAKSGLQVKFLPCE